MKTKINLCKLLIITLFTVIPFYIKAQEEALYMFVQEGNEYSGDLKFGFKNIDGNIVVPYIYDFIPRSIDLGRMEFYSNPRHIFLGQFNEGMALVYKKDIGYGFINNRGEEVIPCQYKEALAFTEGLAAVENIDGKWGYINTQGELIIPYMYGWPQQFKEGVALVNKSPSGDDKFYYINTKGEILNPIGSDYIGYCKSFSNGRGAVRINDKYGYIDNTGKLIIPCVYEFGDDFYPNGQTLVTDLKGNKMSIDSMGNVIIKRAGIDGWYYNNEKQYYSKLYENKKIGLIRDDGKIIINPIYDEINFNNASKTIIAKDYNNKFGVLDLNGKIIIPFEYDSCNGYSEGLYLFGKKDKYGFVNKKGDIEIPFEYDKAYNFSGGLTPVQKGAFWTFINKQGSPLTYFYETMDDLMKHLDECDAKVLNSELDINIPICKPNNENTFVLIIGNEKYMESSVPTLTYGYRDAETIYRYINQTLGVPEKNIHLKKDATLSQIITELNWLSKLCESYGEDASIIIYYTGHGVPDIVKGNSYLLPSDGIPTNTETMLPLNYIYDNLGDKNIKGCFVFLDACFSGQTREGSYLNNSRGITIKNKDLQYPNLFVLAAAENDETAFPYISKGHGMFTYYLLDILNQTNGDVELQEISDYVISKTKINSLLENNVKQTPNVYYGSKIDPSFKLKY